jgi:hypothetical protein
MKVSDLTIEQFRDLIKEAVQEQLAELLRDPDEGLALRPEFRERLERSLASKERISFDDVKSRSPIVTYRVEFSSQALDDIASSTLRSPDVSPRRSVALPLLDEVPRESCPANSDRLNSESAIGESLYRGPAASGHCSACIGHRRQISPTCVADLPAPFDPAALL